MKQGYRLLGLGVLIALLLLIGFLAKQAERDQPTSIDPTLRTIVVVPPGIARPTPQGNDILVDLERGAVPAGIHRATVVTDQECAPDANGVSHCLNEMVIGRTTFAIRHHHNMMEEPCFSPTEQVNVIDAATYSTISDKTAEQNGR